MKLDRRLWVIGLLAWIAPACSGLSANEEKFAEVPSGTSLEVRLDRGVNSDVTRPGQSISASVAEPVILSGQTLIPAGSTFSGTVTAISQKPPSMTVEFTELRTSDVTLLVETRPTIVRLAEHSEMKDEGAKIGGGAAAGAVIGGVVGGDVKSAAIGAAAGAAAGTGVALATKERYAYLPAGAKLNVQLDESVHVPIAEADPQASD
jgi:outer membrane lipoprotein SlyB